MRKLLVTAAILGMVAVIAGPATAGHWKGKGKGNGNQSAVAAGTIAVNQTDLHHGDAVTFSVTYSTDTARIWVRCWQAGEWVYQKTGSEWATFLLSSATWTSGEATCTADLYHDVYQGQTLVAREWLAQTSFPVSA